MSRKDYILLANALLSSRPPATAWDLIKQWVSDAESICDALASNNASFNRSRFLVACGVNER